jgi:hypothetical protein
MCGEFDVAVNNQRLVSLLPTPQFLDELASLFPTTTTTTPNKG